MLDRRGRRVSTRLLVLVVGGQLLLAAALIAAVLLGAFDISPDRADGAGLAPRPALKRFDERRAFALLREQVERFGPRPAGSPASRALAERLVRDLPSGRLESVPGGLRNVVGSLPGRRPAILVGAHYDTEAAPAGFVGANDGAAGTAVVVEVARALARERRPRNAREVRFVLFDGEEEVAGTSFFETGLRGSRAYAARHAKQLGDVVVVDYVGERGLRIPREAGSDPGLWRELRAAAGAARVGRVFPDETRGEIVDDHTPFALAGVRAIDLIDFDYPWRDTVEDTVDKTSPRSLDAVGESVTELVRRLRTM